MLQQTKDVQDELEMVTEMVTEQMGVLSKLKDLSLLSNVALKSGKWEAFKLISRAELRLSLLDGLQARAHSTYQSVSHLNDRGVGIYGANDTWILDLLNAKQHQANVSEARSSRKAAQQMERIAREAELAAKEDRRQGDAIMLVSTLPKPRPLHTLNKIDLNTVHHGYDNLRKSKYHWRHMLH